MAEREFWNNDQVEALISIWEDEDIKRQLANRTAGVRNAALFKRIADKLELLGVKKTPKQVQGKVNNILQQYKKIIDHNNQSASTKFYSWVSPKLFSVISVFPYHVIHRPA